MLGGIIYRRTTVTLPALFERNGASIIAAVNSLFQDISISGNVVATLITSCLYLVGMLGQYAGGKVGEKFDLRYSYLAFHLLTIPAAFMVVMFLWYCWRQPILSFYSVCSRWKIPWWPDSLRPGCAVQPMV